MKPYSVFDLLYQQCTQRRLEFLQKYTRISEYDSENLMYAAISDMLRKGLVIFNRRQEKETINLVRTEKNLAFACGGW